MFTSVIFSVFDPFLKKVLEKCEKSDIQKTLVA